MKRIMIWLLAAAALLALSACGGRKGDDIPSKAEIQQALTSSDNFWYAVAPAAPGDYRLTDLSIEMRFTQLEETDESMVLVTAESDYAVYSGIFSVKYRWREGEYTLASISQTEPGTYSNIKLPEDDFAAAFFQTVASQSNGTLLEAAVEGDPDDESFCLLNGSYTARDDSIRCTSTVSACAPAGFVDGAWQVLTDGYLFPEAILQVVSEEKVFDAANEIYWTYGFGSVQLVNAYVLDGQQYYDRFVYESFADIDYKDIIRYGFETTELRQPENSCYMGYNGVGTLLGASTGPMDQQAALDCLAQIKKENPELRIILDAQQYLDETLIIPGNVVIAKEYTDEDGMHVAKTAFKNTFGALGAE